MAWFDDEDGAPPVSVGTQVTMQLRDTRYWDENGVQHYLTDRPFRMTVTTPDDCYPIDPGTFDSDKTVEQHSESICPECIDSWFTDYYIIYTRDEMRIS